MGEYGKTNQDVKHCSFSLRCDWSVRLRSDGLRDEGEPAEHVAQLLHPRGADARSGLVHADARTRPKVSRAERDHHLQWDRPEAKLNTPEDSPQHFVVGLRAKLFKKFVNLFLHFVKRVVPKGVTTRLM